MADVLREFVKEALLLELRRDKQFISQLRTRAGFGKPKTPEDAKARKLADDVISDIELEIGEPLSATARVHVVRFVAKHWKDIVARFRGDQKAAKQTLMNMLVGRFSMLRTG
jgi:hypothetical protein